MAQAAILITERRKAQSSTKKKNAINIVDGWIIGDGGGHRHGHRDKAGGAQSTRGEP